MIVIRYFLHTHSHTHTQHSTLQKSMFGFFGRASGGRRASVRRAGKDCGETRYWRYRRLLNLPGCE